MHRSERHTECTKNKLHQWPVTNGFSSHSKVCGLGVYGWQQHRHTDPDGLEIDILIFCCSTDAGKGGVGFDDVELGHLIGKMRCYRRCDTLLTLVPILSMPIIL